VVGIPRYYNIVVTFTITVKIMINRKIGKITLQYDNLDCD